MLNPLGLIEKDGRVLVSSVDVAEHFEKRHKNVIRAIEKNEKNDKSFTELNFEPSEYIDSTGRKLPSYYMTRDGFTLLVMGFTGYKAMDWKVKYIKAFNAMEAQIAKQAAAALPPKEEAALVPAVAPYGGYRVPQSYAEALQLAADLERRREELAGECCSLQAALDNPMYENPNFVPREKYEELEFVLQMESKKAQTAMTTASIARKRELALQRRLDTAMELIKELKTNLPELPES